MTIKILSLMLLAQLFEVTAQLLFKKGADSVEFTSLRGFKKGLLFFRQVLCARSIWLGFLGIACGLTLWVMVLSKLELSFAFPFESMQYLMILAGSAVFLKEKIGPERMIGTLFIVLGIIAVAASS